MSQHEYRAVIETGRRDYKDTLRKCEASRDYWKFTAIALFFISLFCILNLSGCLPDSN
jgi:hypothetical protein